MAPDDVVVDFAGGKVGAWAFTATGAVLALGCVGLWWRWKRRSVRAEASAFAAASVRAADELAELAGYLADADGAVLERYATAHAMVEQATTAAELAVAREVLAEGLHMAGHGSVGPAAPSPPAAVVRPASTDDVRRLVGVAVASLLTLAAPVGEVFQYVGDEVARLFATHADAVYAIGLGTYLLTRRPQDVGRAGRVVGVAAVAVAGLWIASLHRLADEWVLPVLGSAAAVVVGLFLRFRRPVGLSVAAARSVFALGVVVIGYTVAVGLLVEETVAAAGFVAVAYLGYGVFGMLAACGLFAALAATRWRANDRTAAARRARAYADLLRLAVVVSTSDSEELESLTARYLDAKDAFERGDYG